MKKNNFLHRAASGLLAGSMALGTFCTVFTLPAAAESEAGDLERNLIPLPATYSVHDGSFVLSEDTAIIVQAAEEDVELTSTFANVVAEIWRTSTGYDLPVTDSGEAAGNIVLKVAGQGTEEDESYTVEVTSSQVEVTASRPAGIWNGLQTLRQLLPDEAEKKELVSNTVWAMPCCSIEDEPEYSYRGQHLDVARHFFTVQQVERQIDLFSQYKINKIHLHLADDQGWRIEITGEMYGESLSNLTTIGASTSCSRNGYRPGYYTQDDLREIVAYAAARNIEIVPEIDMPGHTWAALVSLKFLNSTEDGLPETTRSDVVNTAPYEGTAVGFSTFECRNEKTYEFIDEVIKQISAICPSKYFHVGGDEANATTDEDYSYFMNRVQEIAESYGKIALGWQNFDQVVEDKENSVVQYWSNNGSAYKDGVKYLASPANYAYLDMKYDRSSAYGLTWAGLNPVENSYSWDPADYGSKDQVVGVEGCLWAETMISDESWDYMLYPRLCSIAEIGWTPKALRSWDDFKVRLASQKDKLIWQGVNLRLDESIWPPAVFEDAEYSFDEGEGTTVYGKDLGTDFAGTIRGDVEWVDGISGSALRFNGNGSILFGVSDIDSDWTAAMWVRRAENQGTNMALLSGSDGELKLEQWKNTGLVGLTQFGVEDYTYDYSAPLGEWVHLAWVCTENGTDLYVNGELSGHLDARIKGPMNTLGCNSRDNTEDAGYLYGDVDELKFFSSAKTADEIKAIYDEVQKPDTTALKSLLKTAIDYAEAIKAGEDFEKLAPAVQELINTTLETAKSVYDDEDATPDEVEKAWINLTNAIHYAGFYVDKSALEQKIQEAEALDLSPYTEESVAAFNEALAAAKETAADETALQERIDKALNDLIAAMNGLTETRPEGVDKTLLALLLKEGSKALENEASYVHNDAWNAFVKAMADGQNVYDNEATTQDEVDAAVNALNGAWLSIRLVPDEALLKELAAFIDTAKSINRSLFTASELNRIDGAAAKAADLLESKAFTESEFAQFKEEMDDILDLIRSRTDQTTPAASEEVIKPVSAQKTSVSTTEKSASAASSVKTSVWMNPAIYSAATAAACASLAAMNRRRRK